MGTQTRLLLVISNFWLSGEFETLWLFTQTNYNKTTTYTYFVLRIGSRHLQKHVWCKENWACGNRCGTQLSILRFVIWWSAKQTDFRLCSIICFFRDTTFALFKTWIFWLPKSYKVELKFLRNPRAPGPIILSSDIVLLISSVILTGHVR